MDENFNTTTSQDIWLAAFVRTLYRLHEGLQPLESNIDYIGTIGLALQHSKIYKNFLIGPVGFDEFRNTLEARSMSLSDYEYKDNDYLYSVQKDNNGKETIRFARV